MSIQEITIPIQFGPDKTKDVENIKFNIPKSIKWISMDKNLKAFFWDNKPSKNHIEYCCDWRGGLALGEPMLVGFSECWKKSLMSIDEFVTKFGAK